MTRLGSSSLTPPSSTLKFLGLDLEQEAEALADVVTEQGPLLKTHLVGVALDVEHAVAVDLFEEPRATAGERLGLGSDRWGRRRANSDNQEQCRNPHRYWPHELMSFFVEPSSSTTVARL